MNYQGLFHVTKENLTEAFSLPSAPVFNFIVFPYASVIFLLIEIALIAVSQAISLLYFFGNKISL